jgi:hypothetical protein
MVFAELLHLYRDVNILNEQLMHGFHSSVNEGQVVTDGHAINIKSTNFM